MRRAVEAAFQNITGSDPEFIFSGWSAKLTESEAAVVERRPIHEDHYRAERLRDAAPELLRLLRDAADFLETLVGDEDQDGRPIIDDDDAMLAEMREAIAKALGPSAQDTTDRPPHLREDDKENRQ